MFSKLASLVAESRAEIVSYGMSLVGAVVLLIVGWIVAGWLYRMTRRLVSKSAVIDDTLKPLIASIVRYSVLIFVVIAVLAQFGVQTTSIITVLGAAGLAVGLALQGTLSNIAAGVMILILRPLKVGEYIDADGIAGTVDEIGLFTTLMTTAEGIYISVPNGQLWNRTIKNYTRQSTRRLDLPVGISYDDDIDQALGVMKKLMAAEKRILKDPGAQVMVTQLADSAVILHMRAWTRREDYWDVFYDMTRKIKYAFDEAGLSIPFPQTHVHVETVGGTAAPS